MVPLTPYFLGYRWYHGAAIGRRSSWLFSSIAPVHGVLEAGGFSFHGLYCIDLLALPSTLLMLIPSPFGICFARHNGNAYWAILHASDSISMVASCHGCSLRLPQARCHRHAAACTVRCCYPWSLPRFLLVSGCTFVEAHCCFELSQM